MSKKGESFKMNRNVLRIISIIVLQSFILTQVSWAAPCTNLRPVRKVEQRSKAQANGQSPTLQDPASIQEEIDEILMRVRSHRLHGGEYTTPKEDAAYQRDVERLAELRKALNSDAPDSSISLAVGDKAALAKEPRQLAKEISALAAFASAFIYGGIMAFLTASIDSIITLIPQTPVLYAAIGALGTVVSSYASVLARWRPYNVRVLTAKLRGTYPIKGRAQLAREISINPLIVGAFMGAGIAMFLLMPNIVIAGLLAALPKIAMGALVGGLASALPTFISAYQHLSYEEIQALANKEVELVVPTTETTRPAQVYTRHFGYRTTGHTPAAPVAAPSINAMAITGAAL